ncbi:hypothetical protein, partial [Acinetobacter sp.]|uniref:hypothetical protein n=1 Tax=Acinetobacter sp. TaxID=472 RepID=UPI0028A06929
FMATFIGLIMNSKCQQTLNTQTKIWLIDLDGRLNCCHFLKNNHFKISRIDSMTVVSLNIAFFSGSIFL